jgi:hypothetical protein
MNPPEIGDNLALDDNLDIPQSSHIRQDSADGSKAELLDDGPTQQLSGCRFVAIVCM